MSDQPKDDAIEVDAEEWRNLLTCSCAAGPWLTEPPGEDVPDNEQVLWSGAGVPVSVKASWIRSVKPLSIDQQIQIARVLGHLSCQIEGTSIVREHHEFIREAAASLCPIINFGAAGSLAAVDDLWELGGLPEGGLGAGEEFPKRFTELAAPLVRARKRSER